ncbi:MAG: hypothetical protein QOG52_2896, partial [Frankiaceae bacterium]|nr:hypothetical protein [Frankiaceae bacterium]
VGAKGLEGQRDFIDLFIHDLSPC